MPDSNVVFSTQYNNAIFTPNDIFYKSRQKALVLVGFVENGPIEVGEKLFLNYSKKYFTVKQLQIEGVGTEKVTPNQIVGIQLDAKPSDLMRLGLSVRISRESR